VHTWELVRAARASLACALTGALLLVVARLAQDLGAWTSWPGTLARWSGVVLVAVALYGAANAVDRTRGARRAYVAATTSSAHEEVTAV